ncbi:MAG: HAMP domain-containing protein [Magnetovibrio sp.]|nr:HAMP domain-containing protein [Magnetovibrio sp.]
MKKFLPKTLTSQTILVLFIGLTFSHLISMAIYSSDRAEALTQMGGQDTAHHLSNIARLINQTPTDQRSAVVSSINEPGFNVWTSDESPLMHDLSPSPDIHYLRAYLAKHLSATEQPLIHIRVHKSTQERPNDNASDSYMNWLQSVAGIRILNVSLRLDDPKLAGPWLNFKIQLPQSNFFWSGTSLLSMLSMSFAVILLSLWVVHRLTVPLRAFSHAATRLGKDVDAPPLAEQGPLEIQESAIAFNKMQERLKRMIKNRTQMLAAISHDLRTPITLLRLRSELVENEEERNKMLATLDDMEKMIASTMNFAREDAKTEEYRKVDLTALVASICDDMSDAGRAVTFEEPEKYLYTCRSLSLRRAIINLIDNALKFGDTARVSMTHDDKFITISVEDQGPGIDEDKLDDVFQPFFRCERSRNLETGGTGLGLSIVQSVAHAHGGHVVLSNLDQHGLRAELQLPA